MKADLLENGTEILNDCWRRWKVSKYLVFFEGADRIQIFPERFTSEGCHSAETATTNSTEINDWIKFNSLND